MTIFVDVDGVLCDFAPAFVTLLGDIRGVELPLPTQYDFSDLASADTRAAAWKELAKTPGLVRNLPWAAGAEAALARLRATGQVVVALTAPMYNGVWVDERFAWLKERGFNERTVIFTHAKQLLCRQFSDVLFEDSVENWVAWSGRSYLVKQPWNNGHYTLPELVTSYLRGDP